MPRVVVHVIAPGHDPHEAYQRVADFARYPELTAAVHDVRVENLPGTQRAVLSHWQVAFRDGELRWSERDVFDDDHLVIAFEQTAGDFESFSGRWDITPSPEGAEVRFQAEFDLGMPSLAPMLDPVAQAALRRNIVLILEGLLSRIVLVVDPLRGAVTS